MLLLQVAIGGAVGAVARFGLTHWSARALGAEFPAGTLIVNVLGSALIGLAAVWVLERGDGRLSPFLITGVLGGFTTFSAFSLDTLRLIEAEKWGDAMLYIGSSVVLSVLAVFVGVWLARSFLA